MWHILSFILCPFLLPLSSGSHVSSPSITLGFHAFAEHVGHGGQDGSKIKTGKGRWIHLILICIVWGIQIYILSLLLTKDRQLYLMGQIFGDRQKEPMFSAPSVKPCVLHVFVFINSHIPNCQCVTYGLRPCFVFRECSSLPRLLCMVASFKILIYSFIFYICCWH